MATTRDISYTAPRNHLRRLWCFSICRKRGSKTQVQRGLASSTACEGANIPVIRTVIGRLQTGPQQTASRPQL
jgi:hypothetical protein